MKEQNVFDLTTSFEDLGLNKDLLRAIEAQGFEHPTQVQADLIPIACEGRDVLGQSRTGSGKTAAFALPVLQRLDGSVPFAALILVPTRELAIQVCREIAELAKFTKLKALPVYGGQRINVQADELSKNPHIIVGTPGRVMDMHARGYLPYKNVQIAVLDEVDRVLDIGFREDIKRILGGMKTKHQTIFVSATISPEIHKLARQYMDDPVGIEATDAGSLTVSQVTQRYFAVERWDKQKLLVHLLTHEEPALTIVFCRTKQTVDKLTAFLNNKNIEAHAIHGDMYQRKRNQVMEKLRDGELSVLVASDLAARGLDVDDISHVINYDLPEDPEVYVHRIGRTARAGRNGIAWAFVSPDQGELLTAIEMLTNVEIPKAELDGFKPGPVPADVRARQEMDAARQEKQRTAASRSSIAPPTANDATDDAKFPGGLVPKSAPGKRMQGRVRTRRGR
ncbi:MAG: DEAD/DEAH box helicase [Phycisphaerales bacterium]|nr:DEAD/DEAH box helicase [Phycisphaerales bacterium]